MSLIARLISASQRVCASADQAVDIEELLAPFVGLASQRKRAKTFYQTSRHRSRGDVDLEIAQRLGGAPERVQGRVLRAISGGYEREGIDILIFGTALERFDDIVPAAATELEQDERIAVELGTQYVMDCRNVLAGVHRVGTRAFHRERGRVTRDQWHICSIEDILDILRHVTGQELRRVEGLASKPLSHAIPLLVIERLEPDFRFIRPRARALDLSRHHAWFYVKIENVAPTRVITAALQAGGPSEPLERCEPTTCPPMRSELRRRTRAGGQS